MHASLPKPNLSFPGVLFAHAERRGRKRLSGARFRHQWARAEPCNAAVTERSGPEDRRGGIDQTRARRDDG